MIFDSILNREPLSPVRLNLDVPAELERIIAKCLEKDRNLRYQHASDVRTDLQRLKRDTESATRPVSTRAEASTGLRNPWKMFVYVAMPLVAMVVGGYLYLHRTPKPSFKDTIVLADFMNTTGDVVFDATLRQGLSVQLEQSPFLSVVAEEKIQQTLRMMGQKTGAQLTPEIAREICQRTGSTVVLDGSIAQIGTQYSLILKAVNCSTGELLASTEAQASDKNHVLNALGTMAANIRKRLGESATTLQKFNASVEQATTPSLEALQAYSLGTKNIVEKSDYSSAVLFFQRAVLLDPNFAMAYASLGNSYYYLGETGLATDYTKKAYGLRDRTSERERFYIVSHYHHFVTGDLEKARDECQLWLQTYLRDPVPHDNLGDIFTNLGLYEKALAEYVEHHNLAPESALSYVNLVFAYLALNRFDEARATAEEAHTKGLDSPTLRSGLYFLAFAQNNPRTMAEQVSWSIGRSGEEDFYLAGEGDSAAYHGRLGEARKFSRRAIASAGRASETAATYEVNAAIREALVGNADVAKSHAKAALGRAAGREVVYGAALVLALTGGTSGAQAAKQDLAKRFAEDTLAQVIYLPTIQAQLELSHSDPAKAIDTLQSASPYELGTPGNNIFQLVLYPAYVRGKAYLAAHRGGEAAAEFQKLLDHRDIVLNESIGALAHLQLARAYAMSGEATKARTAYQDFLTLWKDADSDIPILKEAKAEYATLQ